MAQSGALEHLHISNRCLYFADYSVFISGLHWVERTKRNRLRCRPLHCFSADGVVYSGMWANEREKAGAESTQTSRRACNHFVVWRHCFPAALAGALLAGGYLFVGLRDTCGTASARSKASLSRSDV